MSSLKSPQATKGNDSNGNGQENGHCPVSPDAWEEKVKESSSLKPLPAVQSLPNHVALYLISFLTPGQDPRSWGPILWDYLLFFTLVHPLAAYAIWLIISGAVKWQTIVTAYLLIILGLFGILAGAHRLWSHKSYKARLPFALFLAFANTVGTMWSIYRWAKDHRQHHKYTDTDADVHNASRGFFYAHIGWLLFRRHPLNLEKMKCIDTSDLKADRIVWFQHLWYKPLALTFGALLPTLIPVYCWDEAWLNAFLVCALYRALFTWHNIFLINSAAHLYGSRPYSKRLKPRENMLVSYATLGEGYHNYHHYFPSDYSASELGWNDTFNPSSLLIEAAELVGLAYDLKKPNPALVAAARAKLGDGTYDEYLEASRGSFGFQQCALALLYLVGPLLIGATTRWSVLQLIDAM